MGGINRTIIFDSIISGGTGTNDNDYVTGTTFNTETGDLTSTRLSGGTIVTNLDGRYSTGGGGGGENTDDYTITAELSGDTLNFTRLSGGTYSVILSGLTGSTVAGPITFDIDTSGSTSYVGYGEVNACKIRRVITLSGFTYSAYWSNGEEVLNKIWTNRYTYPYF